MKLNLGCGTDTREGYLNIDFFRYEGIDKVLDLNKFPYPFEKDKFEEIILQDIFEHLGEPIRVLNELFRISKGGAILKIRVPHFSSANTWGDLTHKRGFSHTIFNNYSIGKLNSTSLEKKRKMNFRIKKIKLLFPSPYRFLGFNQIFSLIPKFYERFLYGIFPCGNIYFELEVKK